MPDASQLEKSPR